MQRFEFLDDLVGEHMIYEDILVALIEEKMTFEQLSEYLKKEKKHTYSDRTIRAKLQHLQNYNLVNKENDGHTVLYRIPDWYTFKNNSLNPLREKAKRNIFEKVQY